MCSIECMYMHTLTHKRTHTHTNKQTDTLTHIHTHAQTGEAHAQGEQQLEGGLVHLFAHHHPRDRPHLGCQNWKPLHQAVIAARMSTHSVIDAGGGFGSMSDNHVLRVCITQHHTEVACAAHTCSFGKLCKPVDL